MPEPEWQTLCEVERDDVTVEAAAGELQRAFIDRSDGQDVVVATELCESSILIRLSEHKSAAPYDCEIRR